MLTTPTRQEISSVRILDMMSPLDTLPIDGDNQRTREVQGIPQRFGGCSPNVILSLSQRVFADPFKFEAFLPRGFDFEVT